jgi:ADP-ribose pyrophosphatase YjhB (NUDIX family)
MPQQKMSEVAYREALDHLVITCVDLVFTQGAQVLLAQRRYSPRASWWIVGGRMVAGEAPLDTACRKAREEAGLGELSPERFRWVGVYSTCFAQRRQPPEHHGSHSVNLTYAVELTWVERQHLTLTPEEYRDWQWVDYLSTEMESTEMESTEMESTNLQASDLQSSEMDLSLGGCLDLNALQEMDRALLQVLQDLRSLSKKR